MSEFEKLLSENKSPVERFVKYRLSSKADADDLLQEIYLTAYQKFPQLKNRESFKAWLLSIARNKCNDYYRQKAGPAEIPIDAVTEQELSGGRYGIPEFPAVAETLALLGEKDRQILSLYFWKELSQTEIAARLELPLGTVKSRLHTARRNFRDNYPLRCGTQKGASNMKKLPILLPDYKITESRKAPFAVKYEELMGWFLIPRPGEALSWGMYELPSRKCLHIYDMKAAGKAIVHGIEGVELTAREAAYSGRTDTINRTFVAQLTDTRCRFLAAQRDEGGVRHYITFLDGDAFLPIWGYGEDNCGRKTNLSPKGIIRRNGAEITCPDSSFLLDITGRYTVTIGGRDFDTVCVISIESSRCDVISEQFLDKNGRTILWRRYNRDGWAADRYGGNWSERMPENERLTVNGGTYVHCHDCITDYILSS